VNLIDLIGTIEMIAPAESLLPEGDGGRRPVAGEIEAARSAHRSKDILGRVYEYFLGQFASAEGKKGGQFYTPSSVVRTLVEMLAPDQVVGNGTRLVPRGTVLVMVRGMGLHQGVRISQAQRDVTFNQDVKALVPTTVNGDFLLFAMLNAAQYLFGKVQASGHGTGVIPTDIIQSLRFAVPPDDVLRELTDPLTNINRRIHANTMESLTLSALRDTLLPKLLSGELPVPAALTATEEALT
jgi:hypothetical protein